MYSTRSSGFTLAGTAVSVTVAASVAKAAPATGAALTGDAFFTGELALAAACGAEVGSIAPTFTDG